MRICSMVFVLLQFASVATSAADVADQLMPTEQVSLLQTTTLQDGRALRITVRSGSSMVATWLSLACYEPPPPPKLGCQKGSGVLSFGAEALVEEVSGKKQTPKAKADSYYEPTNCYVEAPRELHSSTFSKTVKPGSSVEIYTELPSGVRVARCSVAEARGRQRSWIDNF